MPKTDGNTYITNAQKSLPYAFDPRTTFENSLGENTIYISMHVDINMCMFVRTMSAGSVGF